MPEDFNKENSIEDEIEKSLLKMVEEETNVAKAFVDTHANSVKSSAPASVDNGKTQVIPVISKDMLKEEKSSSIDFAYGETLFGNNPTTNNANGNGAVNNNINNNNHNNNVAKNNSKAKSPKNTNSNKGGFFANMDKKAKLTLLGVCIGVIAVIIAIILVSISIGDKKKDGYDYNYDKGMELYEAKEYRDSISYLEKASKLKQGKNNIELKETLYKCYIETGKDEDAIEVLKDILSYDKDNKNAIKSLAELYYKNKSGEDLSKLIDTYKDSKNKDLLEKYVVEKPKPSVEGGKYDDTVKLKFTYDLDYKLYYTTDGSQPTVKSTLYDDKEIEIINGTTKVKAFTINDIGVKSEIIELEYVVEYGAPSAPEINPASGTYDNGTKISIVNIPEKSKAYYTLDGTTPSNKSKEYTGEFDMPEGNTIVSVVIINEHDQSSRVVKRNYNVKAKQSYEYNDALKLLKNTLVARGVVKEGATTTTDGASVEYVYQTKTEVNGVEMYIVRFDKKKNSTVSTAGYYGIGVSSGKLYVVTNNNGKYTATDY